MSNILKPIGPFGEAEERHKKMIQKMAVQAALMKYIESFGDYPDFDDPKTSVLLDEMLKIVLAQFEEVYDHEETDA